MVVVAAVVVVVVVVVDVVIVIVATRCRRCGGAGIGDGTSAGSPGTGATLSRFSAASINEIGLLPSHDGGNVVVVVTLIVAASTAGENRGGLLLKGIFATRRRRWYIRRAHRLVKCVRISHTYTRVRTLSSVCVCAGSRG